MYYLATPQPKKPTKKQKRKRGESEKKLTYVFLHIHTTIPNDFLHVFSKTKNKQIVLQFTP